MTKLQYVKKGLRDGIPIGLGYFAVSLALGISARNAGLSAFQATLTSALINASAGEYVGFALIAANSSYFEVALMELIANMRYLLMSCALSQKLSPDTPLRHRLLLGFYVTDEIFGLSVAVEGKLSPFYSVGMILVAAPGWAGGTLLGVLLGSVLPVRVVSALGVALFAMFIAVFIPPARKNKIIALLVGVSFALSWAVNRLSVFDFVSPGMKTIALTLIIAGAAALVFPVKEEAHEE